MLYSRKQVVHYVVVLEKCFSSSRSAVCVSRLLFNDDAPTALGVPGGMSSMDKQFATDIGKVSHSVVFERSKIIIPLSLSLV